MPLRMLFRYLANNEKLVQRLSESYPMKRAAQLCVALYYRSQNIARDKIPLSKIDIESFLSRFKQNVTQSLKDARESQAKGKQKFK